jgi:hypothetical protein
MMTIPLAVIMLAVWTAWFPKEEKWKWAWASSSSQRISFSSNGFGPRQLIFNSSLANSFQVLLSMSYFVVNRLCTSVCFAEEWNSYALTRKGLRTTNPIGAQRGTHFLQLPYRWAIPLTTMSGVLHWLLSQSFFTVYSEYTNDDGTIDIPHSSSYCGFSSFSLLVFGICYILMLVVVYIEHLTKFNPSIPIAEHCSLVISAACHPPSSDIDPHLKPVKWGVVQKGLEENIDYCTFTSEKVSRPIVGHKYL